MFHFPVQIYIVKNANLCLVFLLVPKLEPNVQLTPPDVQMPSGLVVELGKVQQSPKKRWRGVSSTILHSLYVERVLCSGRVGEKN